MKQLFFIDAIQAVTGHNAGHLDVKYGPRYIAAVIPTRNGVLLLMHEMEILASDRAA